MTDIMPAPAGPPAAPEPEAASFWVRGGALMIDIVLLLLPTVLIGLFMKGAGMLAGMAVGLFVKLGYQTVLVGGWGATLGKMAAGIRVTRLDGTPVGHGRAFVRALGAELSSLMLNLGYLPAVFPPHKRALHDFMADTRVVFVPGVGTWRRVLMGLLGVSLPLAGIAGGIFFSLVMMPAVMQQAGNFDGAAGGYSLLIRLQPKNPGYWNGRCWNRALGGRLDGALEDCETSLRLMKTPDALDSRGLVLLKMGRHEESIVSYSEALQMRAKQPYSLYGRGLARAASGDRAGGEADLKAALAEDPKIGEVFAGFGLEPPKP